MDLRQTPITAQAEVQASLLPSLTYFTYLAKREGKAFVEDVILALQKMPGAFELLARPGHKPDNQLELLVTRERIIFSLDVDQSLNQFERVPQRLLRRAIGQRGIQQGVSDADKCGALRSVELSEHGRNQRKSIRRNSAAAKEISENHPLPGRKIFIERPTDQKRLEKLAIGIEIRTDRRGAILHRDLSRCLKFPRSENFCFPKTSTDFDFDLRLRRSRSDERTE